jgi:hypothetical protein
VLTPATRRIHPIGFDGTLEAINRPATANAAASSSPHPRNPKTASGWGVPRPSTKNTIAGTMIATVSAARDQASQVAFLPVMSRIVPSGAAGSKGADLRLPV